MKYLITQLYTYPIKSLSGIAQQSADLTNTGFAYDRFWMLCEPQGQFITQREIPKLALFQTAFTSEGVRVIYRGNSLIIPFHLTPNTQDELTATIFGKEVHSQKEGAEVNNWFSEQLGQEVILVRRAKGAKRLVNQHPLTEINYPDGHQFLVIGEASLASLNERLEEPVPTNRFRPNIVFSGGTPHIEDEWLDVQIGDMVFASTKNCGRCQITTINQATGVMGKEPLKTLATYRRKVNSVKFGQYFKLKELGKGVIEVGNEIQLG